MNKNTLLLNGSFYTMDSTKPRASAIAINNGNIIAVGSDDEIRAIGGDVVDMGGRCVTPGLVDSHVHFQYYSMGLYEVDLMGTKTREECLERVAKGVRDSAENAWIRGRGWLQDNWPDRQFPTATQLDAVTAGHPAFLKAHSGHAGWANSLALKMAGVDASTGDPDGGQIQRDADGNPTGIFFETAMDLIDAVMPAYSDDELIAGMRKGQQSCWELGLVGLHDFDGRDCFRALQALHGNGELGLRMLKNIPSDLVELATGVGLKSGFGDEWLRIGGVKIFADGALGSLTALMIEPYEGTSDNRGIAVVDKEEMMRIAHEAYANQLSVTTHAIGDRAVHDILDVYESLLPLNKTHAPPLLPNRIEHVQLVHPSDHHRLAELGVIASMQPTHATTDMLVADRNWGARAKDSYAWRTMADSGATVVFGSDSPVESIDPILGIYAAVTRQKMDGFPGPEGWYPEQRFNMHETIEAFTLAGAITSAQDDRMGSISVGKVADLTVYEQDLFEISAEQILETKIAGTMVGGDFKYRTF